MRTAKQRTPYKLFQISRKASVEQRKFKLESHFKAKMNMKVRKHCCRGTTVIRQLFADPQRANDLAIAEDLVRHSEQRSITVDSAEQKAHFGVSLLNNESTSLK